MMTALLLSSFRKMSRSSTNRKYNSLPPPPPFFLWRRARPLFFSFEKGKLFPSFFNRLGFRPVTRVGQASLSVPESFSVSTPFLFPSSLSKSFFFSRPAFHLRKLFPFPPHLKAKGTDLPPSLVSLFLICRVRSHAPYRV